MKAWLVVAGLIVGAANVWAGGAHRIGVGANYWVAVEDIDVDDVDEDGFSYLVSYQYRPTLLGFQADFEMMPDQYGEDSYAPAAYVVLGSAIYGAAGVGIVYRDGEFMDDPFFALKAGLDLEVLPSIYLDVSASFRFDSKIDVEDAIDAIDTDTVFLGAAARIAF